MTKSIFSNSAKRYSNILSSRWQGPHILPHCSLRFIPTGLGTVREIDHEVTNCGNPVLGDCNPICSTRIMHTDQI